MTAMLCSCSPSIGDHWSESMRVYNGEGLQVSILASWIPSGETGSFQIIGHIFPIHGDGKPILIEKTVAYNGAGTYVESFQLTDGTLESFRVYWKQGGGTLQGLPVAVLVQISNAFPIVTGTLLRRTVVSGYMFQTSPIGYPESIIQSIGSLPLVYYPFRGIDSTLNFGSGTMFEIPAHCRAKLSSLYFVVTQGDATPDSLTVGLIQRGYVAWRSGILSLAGSVTRYVQAHVFDFVTPYTALAFTAGELHLTLPPFQFNNILDTSTAQIILYGGDANDTYGTYVVGLEVGYC